METNKQETNFFESVNTNIFDEFVNEELNVKTSKEEQQETEIDNDDASKTKISILDDIVKEELGEPIKEVNEDGDDKDKIEKEHNDENRITKPLNRVVSKLIEQNVLLPFDDGKPIDKYTYDELEELIKSNVEFISNEAKDKYIHEFIESMPQEVKIMLDYVSKGGKDINNVIKLINKISDISSLEVGEDDDVIVRLYLENTNFGDSNEIDEHIELLKSTNKLHDYAKKYKEKLNEMNNKIIENEQRKLEELKKKQEEYAIQYVKNVKEALKDQSLNDVKLPQAKISELYSGLTDTNYTSITNKKTTKLGYLLEKYQFVEPNMKIIAEVLWLLDNPKEYKEHIKSLAKNEVTAEIRKKLLTESQREQNISTNMNTDTDNDNKIVKTKRTIPRNFFSR